jgi:hypothetical protein
MVSASHMSTSATSGEKSSPPTDGNLRLIGSIKGSVTLLKKREMGCKADTPENQLKSARMMMARIRSSAKVEIT